MIKTFLKRLSLVAGALTLVLLLSVSWYYGKSPLFVARITLRGIALRAIGLCVAAHDPSPKPILCATGPAATSKSCMGTSVTFETLTQDVNMIFPRSYVTIKFSENSPIRRSRYSFSYQPASDPQLAVLRDNYRLSHLILPTNDDFENITRIVDWVHGQWCHGTSGAGDFNPGEFDADAIITHARHGDRFWCQVYAMTFVQVAASLGFQARLVSLTKDGYVSSDMHAVAEVWSNRYDKWIVVDPDFNIWYTRKGIPLNALEIHNAVIARAVDTIKIVKGVRRSGGEFESRIPKLYGYYRYFYVDMRNDWLTNRYFPGHPKRSDSATLFWDDPRLPSVLTLMTQTNSPHDLYWDINKTHACVGQPDIRTMNLPVYIDTLTPNYTHFEIVVDGAQSIPENTAEFAWKLHVGRNSLAICSVNAFGHRGIPAKIAIDIERGQGR